MKSRWICTECGAEGKVQIKDKIPFKVLCEKIDRDHKLQSPQCGVDIGAEVIMEEAS